LLPTIRAATGAMTESKQQRPEAGGTALTVLPALDDDDNAPFFCFFFGGPSCSRSGE
jgi:hypothetical protein